MKENILFWKFQTLLFNGSAQEACRNFQGKSTDYCTALKWQLGELWISPVQSYHPDCTRFYCQTSPQPKWSITLFETVYSYTSNSRYKQNMHDAIAYFYNSHMTAADSKDTFELGRYYIPCIVLEVFGNFQTSIFFNHSLPLISTCNHIIFPYYFHITHGRRYIEPIEARASPNFKKDDQRASPKRIYQYTLMATLNWNTVHRLVESLNVYCI